MQMFYKDKFQTENKILNYWLALELLSQNRLPKISERKNPAVFELHANEKLEDKVRNAAKGRKWKNISVYIGSISRFSCLQKIAAKLSKEENENLNLDFNECDNIALACIQLNKNGTYVRNSLSISPVQWFMNESTCDFGEAVATYEKAVEEVEKQILSFVKLDDVEGSDDSGDESSNLSGQFSSNALDYRTLMKIYSTVVSYLKAEGSTNTIKVSVTYYNTIDDAEDEFPAKLSSQFYASDIRLVMEKIQKNETGDNKNGLIDFIDAYVEDDTETDRLDLLRVKDKKEYYENLFEILDVNNMPLGKWPSQYTTSLMQQVAINIAVAKHGYSRLVDRIPITSVNGPPGTGKTTLLQELIVNNVVEKALILSRVDKPDEVYEEVLLEKKNSLKKAYKFKSDYDELNDYGILLASNNNSAVEITTKDLLRDFSKNLQSSGGHSKEYDEALQETYELFNPNCRKGIGFFQEISDTYYNSFNKSSNSIPDKVKKDIKDVKTPSTWSLISAPLGNRSNIRTFNGNVLYYLKHVAPEENDTLTFTDAVSKFRKQYDKVIDVRTSIVNLQNLVRSKVNAFFEKEKKESEFRVFLMERYEIQSRILKTDIDELERCADAKLKEIEPFKEPENEICCNNEEIKRLQTKIDDTFLLNSHSLKMLWLKIIHVFNVLLGITPDVYERQMRKRKEVENWRIEIKRLQEKNELLEKNVLNNRKYIQDIYSQYGKCIETKREKESQLRDLESEKQKLESERDVAVNQYERLSKELSAKLEKDFSSDLDKIVVFDIDFIEKMNGSLEEKTVVHTENPWETVRFKREREKLFACALTMIKYFVFESNRCKKNLEELYNYWNSKNKKDFDGEEVQALFPAYFQSLLLVVPVVSTAFASVSTMFKDMLQPNIIGTLIVDEAGQALPEMAIGALFRSRSAIVVGDPSQVEPIVNDELKIIRMAFAGRHPEMSRIIAQKTASVQNYADRLNRFGTDAVSGEWTGVPLLIHRRCISPMFEISNSISYNGKMIRLSSEPKGKTFYLPTSVWIECKGKEIDKKNHFVKAQGDKVYEIIHDIFERHTGNPSVYVITPFKSVENGIKETFKKRSEDSKDKKISDFINNGIGTIHTFQGKEADEVIFVLGCDQDTGTGSFEFVNANIVNVAVSRAKYRLYIVGDRKLWTEKNRYLDIANQEIIKNQFEKLNDSNLSKRDKLKIRECLPDLNISNIDGEEETVIDTTMLTKNVDRIDSIQKILTSDKLSRFGFASFEELKSYSKEVSANLQLGMYIYYTLSDEMTEDDDVSYSSILFCKAIEQRLKDCLLEPLKRYCGKCELKNHGKICCLSDVKEKDITIGTFSFIFNDMSNERLILQESRLKGKDKYSRWYEDFKEKLEICRNKRNACCHPHKFGIQDQDVFINNVFYDSDKEERGLFFECSVGNEM